MAKHDEKPEDGTESGAPKIPDELIEQLIDGYRKPEDLTGANGLIKQLIGRLVTRAMNAELDQHLGYDARTDDGATARRARASDRLQACDLVAGPQARRPPPRTPNP